MNDSDLEQKYSQKDEYEKKYSQKNRKQNLNVSINFAEYDEQNNELYYEEVTMKSENKYETFAEFVEIKVFCIKCKTMFSFKNKLHKHLKMSCKAIKSTQFYQKKSVKSTKILNVERSAVTKSIIMKFTTFTSNKDYELTFRK
jgi:predicted nucleic-acid-binding Zn-ribbon protein